MTLYKHLTCAERAPLRTVMRHVQRMHRNKHLQTASFDANHALIETLHNFGWCKRQYVAALRRCEQRANYYQKFMCKRSVYPFV